MYIKQPYELKQKLEEMDQVRDFKQISLIEELIDSDRDTSQLIDSLNERNLLKKPFELS